MLNSWQGCLDFFLAPRKYTSKAYYPMGSRRLYQLRHDVGHSLPSSGVLPPCPLHIFTWKCLCTTAILPFHKILPISSHMKLGWKAIRRMLCNRVWSGLTVFICFSVPVGSRGTEPKLTTAAKLTLQQFSNHSLPLAKC